MCISFCLHIHFILHVKCTRQQAPPRDAGHVTAQEAAHLQWWAQYPGVRRVCEVGFNAGHSAAAILLANRNASLISMDLGQHKHVAVAARCIAALFPARFRLEVGDSTTTFPALLKKGTVECDMTRIDGSHLGDAPSIDLENARVGATGPRIIWMDDVGCSNWNCHEPTRVWRRALSVGRVKETHCSVQVW